jgi:hypothetical protein
MQQSPCSYCSKLSASGSAPSRYEVAILSELPSTALEIERGRRRIGDSPAVQPEASMSLRLFAAALLGFGAVTPVLGRDDSQVPLPNYADFCPDYALYSTYPQFVPTHVPSYDAI